MTSRAVHLDNGMLRAELVPLSRSTRSTPDSSHADMFTTLPGAPTTRAVLWLVKDDSVSIYYLDVNDRMVGKPLRILLKKGGYSYEPDLSGFTSGVYSNTIIIGDKTWTKKIVLIQ